MWGFEGSMDNIKFKFNYAIIDMIFRPFELILDDGRAAFDGLLLGAEGFLPVSFDFLISCSLGFICSSSFGFLTAD